jgi:hypothetical protein
MAAVLACVQIPAEPSKFYQHFPPCTVSANPLLCLITFHAQICSLCGRGKVQEKEAATLFKRKNKKKKQESLISYDTYQQKLT